MIGLTDNGAICRVGFMEGKRAADVLKEWRAEWPETVFTRDARVPALARRIFAEAVGRLYLSGTPFQQAIWKQLTRIPAGKVISYGELARRVKNPKAVRAAGTACGANPVPVLVPCHRVIAGSGGLGGFGGGLRMKKALLEAEGVLPGKAA
jgi:O-6-methylguanine DNA methyltransferase